MSREIDARKNVGVAQSKGRAMKEFLLVVGAVIVGNLVYGFAKGMAPSVAK